MEVPPPAPINDVLMWDEHGESLNAFATRINNQVDALHIPDVIKATLYYSRFVNGLPREYAQYLDFTMPRMNRTLQIALRHSLRFQAYKRFANPPSHD